MARFSKDTVAVRLAASKLLSGDRPYCRLGLSITRTPQVIVLAGADPRLSQLLGDPYVDVEELSSLPVMAKQDSVTVEECAEVKADLAASTSVLSKKHRRRGG